MKSLKIRKIGSSLGAIIPKEVLDELHLSEGDSLYLIKESPGEYHLSTGDPQFENQMRVFSEGIKQYKDALKELSKK